MNPESITHHVAPTPEVSQPNSQDDHAVQPAKKPKRVSTKLTVVAPNASGKSVTYDLAKLADQERFLKNLCAVVHRKTHELHRELKIVKRLFHDKPRGTTLYGCASVTEYCEQKLGITRQAFYAEVGDYRGKQKAKDSTPGQGLEIEIKSDPPKKYTEHERQLMYHAGAAGAQLVEAMESGDQDAQHRLREEIKMVTDPRLRTELFAEHGVRQEVLSLKRKVLELTPLETSRAKMAREIAKLKQDHAKLKKLVLRLVDEIVEADRYQALPANLMKVAASIRKELVVDDGSLGLGEPGVN